MGKRPVKSEYAEPSSSADPKKYNTSFVLMLGLSDDGNSSEKFDEIDIISFAENDKENKEIL